MRFVLRRSAARRCYSAPSSGRLGGGGCRHDGGLGMDPASLAKTNIHRCWICQREPPYTAAILLGEGSKKRIQKKQIRIKKEIGIKKKQNPENLRKHKETITKLRQNPWIKNKTKSGKERKEKAEKERKNERKTESEKQGKKETKKRKKDRKTERKKERGK